MGYEFQHLEALRSHLQLRRPGFLVLVLSLSLMLGCGIYSFKGSLPPHLNTVSIPLMQNQTSEFGIAEEISNLLEEHFLSKGLLQLASDERADSRLSLTLISLTERTTQFTVEQQVNSIRVTIKVKAVFEDLIEGNTLWMCNSAHGENTILTVRSALRPLAKQFRKWST